jgi:2,3-bisphosphoglycerate-independent phosphoglycerate mutase
VGDGSDIHKIVFIFLDGFGLGAPGPANPVRPGSLPSLETILGRPLVAGPEVRGDGRLLKPIDACLGVPGTPQSATGQTALFTGVNAARILGYHYPAFPNKPLVDVIREHNIYDKVRALGKTACFANAYSKLYFQWVQEKRRRHSVTTHCLLAAGLTMLTLDDLLAGKAVFWDITRAALATYPIEGKYEEISGREAGRHLAGISRGYDLVVFETFLPDLLGHKKNEAGALAFLGLLDEFISGLRKGTGPETTVVLSSDHGNMEDLSTGLHTTNPVPLLALGPAAPFFENIDDITGITPAVLDALAGKEGNHG